MRLVYPSNAMLAWDALYAYRDFRQALRERNVPLAGICRRRFRAAVRAQDLPLWRRPARFVEASA